MASTQYVFGLHNSISRFDVRQYCWLPLAAARVAWRLRGQWLRRTWGQETYYLGIALARRSVPSGGNRFTTGMPNRRASASVMQYPSERDGCTYMSAAAIGGRGWASARKCMQSSTPSLPAIFRHSSSMLPLPTKCQSNAKPCSLSFLQPALRCRVLFPVLRGRRYISAPLPVVSLFRIHGTDAALRRR